MPAPALSRFRAFATALGLDRKSDVRGQDEVIDVAAAVLLDVVDDVPAAFTEPVEDFGHPDLGLASDQVVQRSVSATGELPGEEEREPGRRVNGDQAGPGLSAQWSRAATNRTPTSTA